MANEDEKSLDLRQEAVRKLTAQDEDCTPDVLRIAPVWPVAGSSGVIKVHLILSFMPIGLLEKDVLIMIRLL